MLKRKNKFLAIALASLGVVGAGSVAFATWLVGVQQTEKNLQLDVLVDETQDVNIRLTAELTNTELVVGEKEIYDNSEGKAMIGTETSDVDAAALTFGFKNFKLTVGEGVTKKFQNVTITCAELYPLTSSGTNLIQIKENSGSELVNKRSTVEGLKYLDFSTITLTADNFDVQNNVYTLKTDKPTTDKFTFVWGDYFGNQSPVNYYNDIYANKESEGTGKWSGLKTDIYKEGELDDQHTNIINELKAMNEHFKGKKINLLVKANFQ